MILVTGGAGYVGSHFLSQFLKMNASAEILVIDNLSTGHPESLSTLRQAKLVNCDMGDSVALASVFSQYPIDAVVHFAGSFDVGESQKKPFKYYENNIIKSIKLFECMEKHAVRKLVFSSSCAIYGYPEYLPMDELHPQKPVNTYGLTKLIIEEVLADLSCRAGWSYVALRYFNAAGAAIDGLLGESHLPETHLLPRVLKAAKGEIDCLEIHGNDYPTADGTCIRDYVHVLDLAEAHLAALNLMQDGQIAEAINLGTSVGVSVQEMIENCCTITGKEIPIKIGQRRAGDPPRLVANSQKAKSILSWEPKRTLCEIIESAWQWELKRRY